MDAISLPIYPEKSTFLSQSNAITSSRHSLSALEQNIMYVLLSKIRRDDSLTKVYSIHIDELKELTGSQPNYGSLRKASKELISRLYTIIDGGKISQLAALSFFRYEKGSATLELKFSSEIRKYFFELQDQYTLFQFQVASRLASKYSKRIYEMLCQFRSSGWFIISVQELKERLKLIDLETGKDTYPKFGEFARRVLEVAKKEINVDYTDIRFDYEIEKTGRKITNLEFKIHSKELLKELVSPTQRNLKELPISTQEDPQISQLETRLVNEFKVSKVLAKDVIKSFPVEKVERVMKGILKENQEGKIKKLGAYSTTIFKAWLNGAEPTFEQTVTKIKHIPLKSSTQTNQTVTLENEIREKLAEFGLGKNTIYGLLVKHGEDLERLENLKDATAKVDKMIEKEEVESNPDSIFQALNRKLNGEMKRFNQHLPSQSNDRLNSMNSLGSLLNSSVPGPKKNL